MSKTRKVNNNINLAVAGIVENDKEHISGFEPHNYKNILLIF